MTVLPSISQPGHGKRSSQPIQTSCSDSFRLPRLRDDRKAAPNSASAYHVHAADTHAHTQVSVALDGDSVIVKSRKTVGFKPKAKFSKHAEFEQTAESVNDKVSVDFLSQLTRIIDQDLEGEERDELPPFVRDIGQSNCHFLEGYFGSPKMRGKRDQARSPRRSPLSFYSDRAKYLSPRAEMKRNTDTSASPRSQRSTRSQRSASVVSTRSPTARFNSSKLETRQREACESLRILCFGAVGNEKWKAIDKNRIFEQQRGTSEEIQKFVEVWSHLDEDGSGDVDFGEFLDYFSRTNVDRLLCMRCVKFLLMKDGKIPAIFDEIMRSDSVSLPRKSTMTKCYREDMMRLLWLKATDEDIEAMSRMFDLYNLERVQVPAPQLLPKKKRKQLLENFNFLDKKRLGYITYSDMVEAELVDERMKNELQSRYDSSGRGVLDADDFLEMLCPFGFQAHERVKRILTDDDTAIHKICVDCRHLPCGDDEFVGWIPEAELKRLKDDCNILLESFECPHIPGLSK